MFKAFIDGQAGTAGLQLKGRLEAHPDIELLQIDEGKRKDEGERSKLMAASDVVFLCLPDAEARLAAELVANDKIVIDTSTAHRVEKGWAYGFSELSPGQRDAVKAAKRVANPGCHATGFISIVYPLLKFGAIKKSAEVACHSVTGYSGGGRKMIAEYESPSRERSLSSPRQYGLSQAHKHLPEMTIIPGLEKPPVFNPIVCDYFSGMAVSVPIKLKGFTLDEISALLKDFYRDSPLIDVLPAPADGFIPANMLSGRDDMRIFVTGNDESATIISVFDNLGKGAAGAAVQNMNIALGLDELTALKI